MDKNDPRYLEAKAKAMKVPLMVPVANMLHASMELAKNLGGFLALVPENHPLHDKLADADLALAKWCKDHLAPICMDLKDTPTLTFEDLNDVS